MKKSWSLQQKNKKIINCHIRNKSIKNLSTSKAEFQFKSSINNEQLASTQETNSKLF